jgi:hypothetical protein
LKLDLYSVARILLASRSKMWNCGRSLVGTAGSNPAGALMRVSCECLCVVRSRSLELVTRPEESYQVWCVRV